MHIFVDADACPVVKIVEKIAKEHHVPVTLLCDTNHILTSKYSKVVVVGAGADAVDYKLITICNKGDIVVSQDYGVAAMALGKGAYAIHQSGKWYTNDNIDRMLMERHLNKKARRSSAKNHIKGPRKRTEEDDERFVTSFEKMISMAQKKEQVKRMKNFEFRNIEPDEARQAAEIERICFPPNEACSEKNMKDRVDEIPDLFLVAVDKENGKIAGFLNGLATDEETLRDDFFTNAKLHNPEGKNIMLLGLDVLPEYRGKGLARELVYQYFQREKNKGREELILTCLEGKVGMYEKFGFIDKGIADSTWGGEEWHEMYHKL